MEYDKKFDNLTPGTLVTASYTEGRKVFKGQITSVNREHPQKPPYFVKLEKGFPEKSLWFYPWEILTAEMGEARGYGRIRLPRTRAEQRAMQAFPNAAGVDEAGIPVDADGVRLRHRRVPERDVVNQFGENFADDVPPPVPHALLLNDPYNDEFPVAGVMRAGDLVAEVANPDAPDANEDEEAEELRYREEDDEDYDPR